MDRKHHDAEEAGRRGVAMNRVDTSFPRRWLHYVALKHATVAIAVARGLTLVGYW
jgi:hypothetical protein